MAEIIVRFYENRLWSPVDQALRIEVSTLRVPDTLSAASDLACFAAYSPSVSATLVVRRYDSGRVLFTRWTVKADRFGTSLTRRSRLYDPQPVEA